MSAYANAHSCNLYMYLQFHDKSLSETVHKSEATRGGYQSRVYFYIKSLDLRRKHITSLTWSSPCKVTNLEGGPGVLYKIKNQLEKRAKL